MKKIILIFLVFLHFQSRAQKSVYDFNKIDSIGSLLDSSITRLNKSHFNTLFNKTIFYQKITQYKTTDSLSNFQKDMKKGFVETFDYGQELINSFKNEGSYSYLHFYIDEQGEFHLIFRLMFNSGLNYHDILLKNKNGNVYIADVYNYYTGENLSKSYQQIYNNILYKRSSESNLFRSLDATQIFNLVNSLIQKGKYAKAFKLINKAPSYYLKQKKFQLVKIDIASHLSVKKYSNALAEYENLYPDDFSIAFLKLDYYTILEKHDKVLKQINILDKKVDGDVFLQYSRATVLIEMNNYSEAITSLHEVINYYPNYVSAYNSLLFCYMQENKITEFMSILDIYLDQFKYKKENIIQFIEKEYPKLKKEPLYLEWIQKHN